MSVLPFLNLIPELPGTGLDAHPPLVGWGVGGFRPAYLSSLCTALTIQSPGPLISLRGTIPLGHGGGAGFALSFIYLFIKLIFKKCILFKYS